nr:D-alanyl-D-alanine carboxypeptidase family protein [Corynebacterium pacaense]
MTAENADRVDGHEDTSGTATPAPRESAPDTDGCPYEVSPSPAHTTSEAVAPGAQTPAALAVPEVPAGGAKMSNCGVTVPAGMEVPADLTASAWMVFDLDSGEILAAKDPHGRYRPASIIKVLLALVAIDELDPARVVTGTREAAEIEGSRVGVGEGGVYTVDQLLHGLLMASGNDAAYLLAQELGGDERTLDKVNSLARDLGAEDTRAATYSGLDAAGMSTSAYDMALIYRRAWQNPTFAEIVGTDHVDFPGWGDNEGFQVWNDNGLFMNDPDGIGGKTGYTDDAHHTFVGAVNRDGRRRGAVILDTTVDHGRPWEQARKLIDASLVVPTGSAVGQLGGPAADTGTVSAAPPATVPGDSPDSPTDPLTGAMRIILPIAAVVLLLLAALVWTFRRRP